MNKEQKKLSKTDKVLLITIGILVTLIIISCILYAKNKTIEKTLENPPDYRYVSEDLESVLISRNLWVYDEDFRESQSGYAIYYVRDYETNNKYKVSYMCDESTNWKWQYYSNVCIYIDMGIYNKYNDKKI